MILSILWGTSAAAVAVAAVVGITIEIHSKHSQVNTNARRGKGTEWNWSQAKQGWRTKESERVHTDEKVFAAKHFAAFYKMLSMMIKWNVCNKRIDETIISRDKQALNAKHQAWRMDCRLKTSSE